MMRLIAILVLASLACARAAYVTIDVTFTNRSLSGSNFVVNGTTVRYTNAPLNNTTWLVTNSAAGSATNLQQFLGANYPSLYSRLTSATNVKVSGTDLQFSMPGNGAAHFAYTATNSASTTNYHAILVPFDTQPYATNRTNDASELVSGIERFSTNAFDQTSVALSNHVNLTNVQLVANKVATNFTMQGGSASNATLINIASASGTLGSLTNGTLNTPTLANIATASGTIGNLTNGILQSTKLTNATGEFRNGYVSNVIAHTVTITNLVAANGAVLYDGTAVNGNLTVSGGGFVLDSFGELFYDGSTDSMVISNDFHQTYLSLSANLFSSHQIVAARGVLSTNNHWLGTNNFASEIKLEPRSYTTSIAGYASAINLGTNAYVRVTGASAAITNASFKGGYAGLRVLVEFTNPGLSCVLLHQSSIGAPASTEKINTGTGALVNMTNNPAVFELMHNGTEWIIISNSR